MAEKKIEIKLAATGGDQAAAEIRKLEASLGIVQKSETELAAARAQFMTAAEAEVAEVERLVAANKKLDASQDQIAANTTKAARSMAGMTQANNGMSVSMNSSRFAVQNAAFQFQDMAVQLEMGTSATRVFSQQVPQLLGSFGAIGAVAGAVIGVGVPVAAALFRSGKEAEEAKPKLDDFKQILEDVATAQQGVADAKAADESRAWLESLDEEEKYYEKIEGRLQRQIALQAKLRSLKEGTDAARREADIAAIDADPNKSAEQKTNEIAAIREEGARAKAEAEKQALADEAAQKAAAAQTAQDAAERQAADAETARKKREEQEAKVAELQRKTTEAANAQLNVPQLEKELKTARRTKGLSVDLETGRALPGYDEAVAEIARIEAELAAAKKAEKKAPETAATLKAERDRLEVIKNGEDQQKREADAARAKAETAYGESLIAGAALREGAPQIDARFQEEQRTREIKRRQELRALEEKRKAKADEEEKQRLQAELQTGESGLDANAREKGLGLRGNRNDTVAAVGKALSDGTDAAELQKLGDMVRDAAGRNSAAMTQALLGLIGKLDQQERELEVIRQKLKNK